MIMKSLGVGGNEEYFVNSVLANVNKVFLYKRQQIRIPVDLPCGMCVYYYYDY